MITFHQNFTIHPVGQGFFYSGIVTFKPENGNNDQFKMVFDCGSIHTANAEEEAASFRDNYLPQKSDRLDLLVISHFDQDHVNKIRTLLDDGRKVNKLVMPFTPFEERLFLVLQTIEENDGLPEDDFATRFALDPLGALSENIDGNTEIFLIDNDPNNPPFSRGKGPENENNEGSDNANFIFDFEGDKNDLTEPEKNVFKSKSDKVKIVQDSQPGILYKGQLRKLMEFLFYKKSIGKDETEFYKKVYELFLEKNKLASNTTINEIIEKVKAINGATSIKKLFKEAKKSVESISDAVTDSQSMNITALCMMHRNLGVLAFRDWEDITYKRHPYGCIRVIKKFDGTEATQTKDESCYYDWDDIWHWHHIKREFEYPNTLLSSDSFLKEKADVEAFHNRYRNVWDKFWLFQVPHHGSKNNANRNLFSKLPQWQSKFINHGITKKRKYLHPDAEVIQDMIATGQSQLIYAVNEYTGLEFEYTVRINH